MGWESDTNKFKIGDGTNHWASLDYFSDINSLVNPSFGTSIVFEGATANDFETTLLVTDPTADRTITFPDATGTVITTGNLSDLTFSSSIVFEGATANEFETTIAVIDPTADRTITFPDVTGTVATQAYVDGAVSGAAITPSELAGSGITWNAENDQFDVNTSVIQARVTDVSDTEIGYLNGVTSGIQTQINDLAPKADPTFTGTVSAASLTLSGDLTVNGTTTNLNSTNLVIEDKNIVLGDTTSPTDTTADGGGITLKGATDKTFNWVDSTDSWTSSEHINLASGKAYSINGTALKDITETLTNKTLTSPTLTSALLSNPIFQAPEERWAVSATAATGTIPFDTITSGILYYTSNASANWTLNVRGNSGTTLNDSLATNDSITVVFFVTNGATPYYQTGFQIDGSSVTPKWQNGSAPSAGNANSIDIYSYTIVKTGNAAFAAFGSQTRFA
jgi:hypothetical protein